MLCGFLPGAQDVGHHAYTTGTSAGSSAAAEQRAAGDDRQTGAGTAAAAGGERQPPAEQSGTGRAAGHDAGTAQGHARTQRRRFPEYSCLIWVIPKFDEKAAYAAFFRFIARFQGGAAFFRVPRRFIANSPSCSTISAQA